MKDIVTSCEFMFAMILVCAVVTSILLVWYTSLDDTELLMDDEIISAEVVDGNKYNYFGELIKITTADDVYILNFDKEEKNIDLTVNSKLILKLYNDGCNEVWDVKKIYKVPGE